MKSYLKIFITSVCLLGLILAVTPSIAQEPPHPPSTGHGNKGNQSPGGTSAPIDGGMSMLIMLSLAVGAKKAFSFNKDNEE